MTQQAILIETIAEKRCDHLFLRWGDLVVLSIRKEPKEEEVSFDDLSC